MCCDTLLPSRISLLQLRKSVPVLTLTNWDLNGQFDCSVTSVVSADDALGSKCLASKGLSSVP